MSGDTVTPNQASVYAALQPFIALVTGLDPSLVIQGLPNRSAMPPASPGFISMQTVSQPRLNQNIDTWDTADPDPSTMTTEMHVKLGVQIDCYGAGSPDWATVLQALLRDDVGVQALLPNSVPLYTDEPTLAPLDDSEQQYEQRWVLMAYIQYNPVIATPMQFANDLEFNAVNVDVTYPVS